MNKEKEILNYIKLIKYDSILNKENINDDINNLIILILSPSKIRINIINYCLDIIGFTKGATYEFNYNLLGLSSHITYNKNKAKEDSNDEEIIKKWKIIKKAELLAWTFELNPTATKVQR